MEWGRERESGREGACVREGGWYKLQSPIYQFRPLDTNCSHLSAAGPVSLSAEWAHLCIHICSSLLRTSILHQTQSVRLLNLSWTTYINLLLQETVRVTHSTRRHHLLRRAEDQWNRKKCLAQRCLNHHHREEGRLSPNQLCQHFLRPTANSCHCFLNQVMRDTTYCLQTSLQNLIV